MLTPLYIESQEFKRRPYGYSVEEVDKFLDEIIQSYEVVYKENIELRDKISMLNEGIQYYKTLEKTLQSTLVLAEKTAEEIKSTAYQKGEQIKREAENRSGEILEEAHQKLFNMNQEIERLRKLYVSAKIQIKQTLLTQLELLEQSALSKENETFEEKTVRKQTRNLHNREQSTLRNEDAL